MQPFCKVKINTVRNTIRYSTTGYTRNKEKKHQNTKRNIANDKDHNNFGFSNSRNLQLLFFAEKVKTRLTRANIQLSSSIIRPSTAKNCIEYDPCFPQRLHDIQFAITVQYCSRFVIYTTPVRFGYRSPVSWGPLSLRPRINTCTDILSRTDRVSVAERRLGIWILLDTVEVI